MTDDVLASADPAPSGSARAAGRITLDFAELASVVLCIAAISAGLQDSIALLASALIAGSIERVVPFRRHRVFGPAWTTDVYHAIVSSAMAMAMTGAVVVAAGALLIHTVQPLRHVLLGQPLFARVVETLLLIELCTYFMHRAQHAVPLLWRFHQVHHSITNLDWLAAWRDHPVDKALIGIATGIPAYVLNIWDWHIAFAVIGIYQTANTPWAHGNFRITLGPLWWLIRNPEFHRWHHSRERVAMNKNFAQTFPVFDVIFGTAYLPRDHEPAAFGLPYPMPARYLDQILVPFQKVPETPRPVLGSVE